MRTIKRIFVHCTAGPQTQTVAEIQKYWKTVNKWTSPGYHYIVKPDGEILRESGNTEELTLEEAQKRLDSYQKKLNELAEKEPDSQKLSIYNTYIKNLQSYIFNYYILHPELMKQFSETTQNEIQKAMEDLKKDVEEEEKETVMDPISDEMDEYTEFEEIKDGEE